MTNTIPEDIDLPFRVDSLSSWTTTIRRELMERDDPSHPSGSRIKCTRVLPGILDWEGVAAFPECLGNLCYPSFLTRDWDPSMYSYNPEDTNGLGDLPAELQSVRALYHDMRHPPNT